MEFFSHGTHISAARRAQTPAAHGFFQLEGSKKTVMANAPTLPASDATAYKVPFCLFLNFCQGLGAEFWRNGRGQPHNGGVFAGVEPRIPPRWAGCHARRTTLGGGGVEVSGDKCQGSGDGVQGRGSGSEREGWRAPAARVDFQSPGASGRACPPSFRSHCINRGSRRGRRCLWAGARAASDGDN